MILFCTLLWITQDAHWSGKSQENLVFIKVREKSGNSVKWSGKLELNLLGASESKLGCKDQESIQSSTTPDPGYQWESDKLTEDTTNESQEVSPFPEGDHEAHINRRAQNIANTRQNKNIEDPQKKYRLGTVSKIFYWRA